MIRGIFALCCLIGIVLGGALAPAIGIQTPIPDLGTEEGDGRAVGEGLLGQGDPVTERNQSGGDSGGSSGSANGSTGAGGQNGSAAGGGSKPSFAPNGSAPNAAPQSLGGTSAGGYPKQTTVGGELTLSDHEELVIESPRPSRWRLGGYTTYTGSGWERREEMMERLGGAMSTAEGTPSAPAYDIRVTTRRPFRSLVTVWRPALAAAPNRQPSVTETDGVVVDEPLQSGETYVTSTYGPPSISGAAGATGAPPPGIRDRYTQLPDGTPPALEAFTSDLTSDTETPYESAATVQSWLKQNKSYSLEATHDPGRDVATEFVFEMDAGYCQYFATSMTAMLRTQGIPARYVTGYGVGEQINDDTYLVRGSDAHAWVEVYIDGAGWVTFDPTPADGRVDAGRDDTRLGDPATEAGANSPEEQPGSETPNGEQQPADSAKQDESADNQEPTESDDEDDQQDEEDDQQDDEDVEPIEITVPTDPVPGRELTVTVTRGEAPVPGAVVSFNGDPVGETDGSGNVTGEVPYNSSLEITAELTDDTAEAQPSESVSASGRMAGELSWLSTGDESRTSAAMGNVTVDVPTEIDVRLLGTPVAGESITVLGTIAGEPVPNATVRVNGTETTGTDAAGQATVDVPTADAAELALERGDARGTATIEPLAFDLEVAASTVVPLPSTGVTATVTLDGDPVENATLVLDGQLVGTTGADGTVGAGLPFADEATIEATASVDEATPSATMTVDDMYRNLALVTAAALLVVLIPIQFARRRGVTARSAARSIQWAAIRGARLALAAIVTLAAAMNSGVSAMARWLRRAIELLSNGIEGAVTLLYSIATGTAGLCRRAAAGIRTLPQRLDPHAIIAALRRLRRSAADSIGKDGCTTEAIEQTEQQRTVREVWAAFRGYVSIRSWRTSTPGEIARWAVSRDGLPRDAVGTITDAFRDVEYGNRSPDDRAPAARDALESIRTADRTEDDGADSEP